MNRTLIKSLLRLIKTSLSRFLAVTAIVSIGVAFFTGVSGSADIMSVSVDEYSDKTNLKDITIYSNYGFDDEDVRAVSSLAGVKTAEGSRFTDAVGTVGSDVRVVRIHSINDPQEINHFILVSGRMPQNEHEALAENGSDLSPGFPLGARIEIRTADGNKNENLKSDYFIITGTVDTPLYLNEVKENSTLSNQPLQSWLYINADAFDMDYYTELNVLTEEGESFNSFSDAYEEYSREIKERVSTLAQTQENVRYSKLRDEALEEYSTGLAAYQDAKKEFEEKIAEGEKELADGEQEIKDGEQQLAVGEEQLAQGIREYDRQSQEAASKLAEALALLNDSSRQLAEKETEFAAARQELEASVQQLREGIDQLEQAKQGLTDIDSGLQEIQDARQELSAAELEILIGVLRRIDPDTPLDEVEQSLEQLADAAGQLSELFPEIAEIPVSQVKETVSEIQDDLRADNAYLHTEEITALMDELRLADPAEPAADLPAELLDCLGRWNPLTVIEDIGTLITVYDRTAAFLETAAGFLESEEWQQLSAFLDDLDDEQSVAEAVSIDPEQLKQLTQRLEEAAGSEITTAGELVSAYDEVTERLNQTEKDLTETRHMIVSGLAEQGIEEDGIDEAIAGYEELIRTIMTGIADGERQLADARRQLEDGYAAYSSSKIEADILLEEGRRKIAEGQREISENKRKLEDARALLKKGREELEKARTESLEQLEEAAQLLKDAKNEIDSMAAGSWTVLDRTSHYASATYHSTIDQMRAIGDIFPLFFILVAALVCLTTMSRMVSEQRNEIGTMRALGYTRLQCAGKYLIYAGTATLAGCIIGSVAGLQSFPRIIYNAWRMMYILPPIVLRVPWRLVLTTSAMFLAAMLMTTWLVIRTDMKEVPSSLMRPKTIGSGRRTVIERLTFFWNRLTFTWKVTLRNIFRYRRRFIMTVLGVAGCCALMVTGYGIRDSINSMVELQFDEIIRFDGTAGIAAGTDEKEIEDLIARLESRDDISEINRTCVYDAKAHGNESGGLESTVTVEIFDSPSDVEGAYQLRTRIGHQPIALSDDGAVINERLAENLGLKKGDTFFMEDENGSYLEVKVSEICELYIYHHAFMSDAYYRSLTGQSCSRKALFIHVSPGCSDSAGLQNDLMEEKAISSISFYDGILENFSSMVKSLDLIVWALLISSMVLAFVVLGNLININVAERQREIATLKVLGFRRREVQSYIFKENNILTAIGALAGLPLGSLLHRYIMSCIEMEFVIFGRSVKPLSFVISAALTIAFGFLVNLAMAKNLDQIAMVESLKSVE